MEKYIDFIHELISKISLINFTAKNTMVILLVDLPFSRPSVVYKIKPVNTKLVIGST